MKKKTAKTQIRGPTITRAGDQATMSAVDSGRVDWSLWGGKLPSPQMGFLIYDVIGLNEKWVDENSIYDVFVICTCIYILHKRADT